MKKIIIKNVFILSFLLFFSGSLFASAPVLKTMVDKDSVTIGERIRYDVIVEYDESEKPEPLPVAENLGEFEIKDYEIKDPEKTGEREWVSGYSYIISIYDIGEFEIPPFTLSYKDSEGNEGQIVSEPIKITVKGVEKLPGDTDDIRPLKAPVRLERKYSSLFFFLACLALITAVSVFIYFKRKNKKETQEVIPELPPEEIASEELNQLLAMDLISKGMIKQYYIRLSDIIRKYIAGKYGIITMDRTTPELYRDMKSKKIAGRNADKIKDFLEECDFVKFAKYIPSKKESEESYKKAEEIVKLT